MLKTARSRIAAGLAVCLAASGAGVLGLRIEMGRSAQLEAREGEIAEFGELEPQAANRFLMCPERLCNVRPDAASPQFDVPWEQLRDDWSRIVGRQRGVRLVAGDGDLGKITYIQRSPILHLPDLITIQFVALGERRSSFALVSQSRYDWPDFGANRARVLGWAAALEAAERRP